MRLIDADALDTLLIDCQNRYSTMLDVPIARTRADEIEAIRKTIHEQIPAIEAEPVRHGHWIELWTGYKCSECARVLIIAPIAPFGNYCPYCGAKMNLGEEDEQER